LTPGGEVDMSASAFDACKTFRYNKKMISHLSWTKAKKCLQEIQKPGSGGCKK